MQRTRWTIGAISVFSMMVISAVAMPLISFGGTTQKLYVDSKASGKQDGSVNHPYKTVEQATDKASEKTQIFLSPGTYVENVTLRRGVEMYGGDPKKVTIKAASSSKPAVDMYHKSRLNNVTVEGGRNGVYVHGKSKALIDDCVIKNSKRDGVHVNASKAEDKYEVSIVGNKISNHDKAGVYIEGSKFALVSNEIYSNDNDGVDLESGAKGSLNKNSIRDNGGAGLRANIDYANVWTKKNTYRDNKKNGVEVNAYGANGRVDLKDSKYINNKQHAIARIQRGGAKPAVWGGLTVSGSASYERNGVDGLSKPIIVK